MTEGKPTEYKTVLIRRANPQAPAELVLSNSGDSASVIVLRPSQLKQLAREAVSIALSR